MSLPSLALLGAMPAGTACNDRPQLQLTVKSTTTTRACSEQMRQVPITPALVAALKAPKTNSKKQHQKHLVRTPLGVIRPIYQNEARKPSSFSSTSFPSTSIVLSSSPPTRRGRRRSQDKFPASVDATPAVTAYTPRQDTLFDTPISSKPPRNGSVSRTSGLQVRNLSSSDWASSPLLLTVSTVSPYSSDKSTRRQLRNRSNSNTTATTTTTKKKKKTKKNKRRRKSRSQSRKRNDTNKGTTGVIHSSPKATFNEKIDQLAKSPSPALALSLALPVQQKSEAKEAARKTENEAEVEKEEEGEEEEVDYIIPVSPIATLILEKPEQQMQMNSSAIASVAAPKRPRPSYKQYYDDKHDNSGDGQKGIEEEEEAEDDEEEDDEGKWSHVEADALRQAHAGVNPRASNFWERVSRRVGTRTSTECCDQWFSSFERPVRNNSKTVKEEFGMLPFGKNVGIATAAAAAAGGGRDGFGYEQITKNKGTAKFRRQVRDAWERLEHGHADDLYESTPLKQAGKSFMCEGMSLDVITPQPCRHLGEFTSAGSSSALRGGGCGGGVDGDFDHFAVAEAETSGLLQAPDRRNIDGYIAAGLKRNRKVKHQRPMPARRTPTKRASTYQEGVTEDGVKAGFSPGGSVRLHVDNTRHASHNGDEESEAEEEDILYSDDDDDGDYYDQ